MLPRERLIVRSIQAPRDENDFELWPEARAMDDAPAFEEAIAMRPGELREKLTMALHSKDVISQNLVIAHLLAQLTPENVQAALQAFEDTPRSEHRDHSFRLFMHAWAKLDGAAALDHLSHAPAHKVGGSEQWAMSGWSQENPAAALDYVDGQTDKRRNQLYPGLIRGWARTDLEQVRTHVEQIEHPGQRKRLVNVLARSTIVDHGGAAALDWVNRTTANAGADDGAFRNTVFNQVFSQMRPEEAPEVAAWIDTHPDHPDLDDWVFQKVSRDYAQADADGAVDWVEKYRLSGSERFNYGVIGNFAGSWAKNDPNAAMEWANNMEQPSRRSSAYSQIAKHWTESDIASAEAWLQAGQGDRLMDDARLKFTTRIAEEDPVRALEYAVQIIRPDMREEGMVSAARVLYQRNPDAVLAWLPVSGLGGQAQARIFGEIKP